MQGVLDIPAELETVGRWVEDSLSRVESRIERTLASDIPAVQRLCDHVEAFRGKMLRPTLALLAGAASGAPLDAPASDELVGVGAVVELVHMATLVHDDVLDEADTRRRAETVNRCRGNEAAVILGDYLIAASFRLCASLADPEPARIIGRVAMRLCAGELLQLENRENLSLDEATYFEILEGKTASLIGASAMLGARAAGATDDIQAAFESFGRDLGVAFQIQDDVLDLLGREAVVGKTLGRDLDKGKLTLPLIHLLAETGPVGRSEALDALTRGLTRSGAETTSLLEAAGSIEHAKAVAAERVAHAKSVLSAITSGPAREALALLADAVLDRNR